MGLINGISVPYTVDERLFNELGLELFKISDQEKHLIGEYKLPHYDIANVKIYVTCTPAQFWSFDIADEYGEEFIIKCGSGSLSDFWNTVLLIAKNMIEIKKI